MLVPVKAGQLPSPHGSVSLGLWLLGPVTPMYVYLATSISIFLQLSFPLYGLLSSAFTVVPSTVSSQCVNPPFQREYLGRCFFWFQLRTQLLLFFFFHLLCLLFTWNESNYSSTNSTFEENLMDCYEATYVVFLCKLRRCCLLVLYGEKKIMSGMQSLASGAGVLASQLLFFQDSLSFADLRCGTWLQFRAQSESIITWCRFSSLTLSWAKKFWLQVETS